MSSERRLLATKDRLTRRLIRRDQRHLKRHGAHSRLPDRELLRRRLFKIDSRLEAHGYFRSPL